MFDLVNVHLLQSQLLLEPLKGEKSFISSTEGLWGGLSVGGGLWGCIVGGWGLIGVFRGWVVVYEGFLWVGGGLWGCFMVLWVEWKKGLRIEWIEE